MTVTWRSLANLAHRWIAPPVPPVHEMQADGTCRAVTVVSDGGLALVTHAMPCPDHRRSDSTDRP